MALGASGAICASAHLRTSHFVRLMRVMAEGHLVQARAIWNELIPMIEMLFAEPNPAPVKAALAAAGWVTNELRLPMQPASALLAQRLASVAVEGFGRCVPSSAGSCAKECILGRRQHPLVHHPDPLVACQERSVNPRDPTNSDRRSAFVPTARIVVFRHH